MSVTSKAEPGPPAPLQINVVGATRYVLYEAFASGGMATVHFGRQHGHERFARTVAIKRLRPEFAADPWHVSMFLDEARVASRIRHPNVVPTLDVVRTECSVLIVMEYVAGESLAALVRRRGEGPRQVPPAVAATLLVDVLHGLHAAHEARDERGEALSVVHRDVSPHNVLVTPDGGARLIDFGVAKARGSIHQTRAGDVKGKVAYMPREQLLGEPVDRRSDVFAASVVLWESLTGRRFFTEDDPSRVVRFGKAEPPSRHAAGVSPGLDAIVLKGLQPAAANRYPTARAMALTLEQQVPLAPRSQVAHWLSSLAGARLEGREAAVHLVERHDFEERQRTIDEAVASRAIEETQRASRRLTAMEVTAPMPRVESRETLAPETETEPEAEFESESEHDREGHTEAGTARIAARVVRRGRLTPTLVCGVLLLLAGGVGMIQARAFRARAAATAPAPTRPVSVAPRAASPAPP